MASLPSLRQFAIGNPLHEVTLLAGLFGTSWTFANVLLPHPMLGGGTLITAEDQHELLWLMVAVYVGIRGAVATLLGMWWLVSWLGIDDLVVVASLVGGFYSYLNGLIPAKAVAKAVRQITGSIAASQLCRKLLASCKPMLVSVARGLALVGIVYLACRVVWWVVSMVCCCRSPLSKWSLPRWSIAQAGCWRLLTRAKPVVAASVNDDSGNEKRDEVQAEAAEAEVEEETGKRLEEREQPRRRHT